jgi:hypothetical protein
MDKFADTIQNVWASVLRPESVRESLPAALQEPVEIALIDDGVDNSHTSLLKKISGGKSHDFGYEKDGQIRPYWVSGGGHGTVMARMISRVCPIAKLYVIRVETHTTKDLKQHINGPSAASVGVRIPPQMSYLTERFT